MQRILKNKWYEILFNCFFYALFIIGATVMILFAVGFRFYNVETGSMGKTYPVNSLIVVQPVKGEKLKDGDVITYFVNSKLDTVTHRIVEINREEEYVITKGDDVNDSDASPVYFENIVGKVICGIPKLGIVSKWSHSKYGRVILIGFTLCMVLLYIAEVITDEMKKRKEKEDE